MTHPSDIPVTQLPPEQTISNAQPPEPGGWQRFLKTKLTGWIAVGVTSLFATGLVVTVRSLGGLQGLELWGYDLSLRQQSSLGPDPRLLIVGITEDDIQRYRFPLSDELLSAAIRRLDQYQPQVIGVDLIRDIPITPGSKQLYQQLQTHERLISICKAGTVQNAGVAPPPGVSPTSIGFMDVVVDPDAVVRRNLLQLEPQGKCPSDHAFSLMLALRYLAQHQIFPKTSPEGYPQLKNTIFRPLESPTGGYAFLDARGYQILLRYRTASQVARQVSLSDLLEQRIDPRWIQGQIVLLGYVAPSVRDSFYTPFTVLEPDRQPTPGVILHAQMLSQVLSAVLDGQPLLWVLPAWAEMLWILTWAVLGAAYLLFLRHPVSWVLATSGVLLAITGTCSVVFGLAAGWLPWIPALLGVVVTNASLVLYWSYQSGRNYNQVMQLVDKQKDAIAVYKVLVEARPTFSAPTPEIRPIPDLVRQTLAGRYYVHQALAQGGFAHTFLAEDRYRPGSPLCVVKCLQPATQRPDVITASRRLFEIEAEILEKLGQHDQIPQLLAYFEAESMFCLVEEYIEGHSLEQELEPNLPCSETLAIGILKDVLEVLTFLHSHHVIHRDVKPSNLIRRQRDQKLVLIDFGAVKQMQPLGALPVSPTVKIGTIGYAPPEQFAGQPVLNSDIYATGILAVQALSGLAPKELPRDPISGEIDWQILHLSCSLDLLRILQRMTRLASQERYTSTLAVLKDLQAIES